MLKKFKEEEEVINRQAEADVARAQMGDIEKHHADDDELVVNCALENSEVLEAEGMCYFIPYRNVTNVIFIYFFSSWCRCVAGRAKADRKSCF